MVYSNIEKFCQILEAAEQHNPECKNEAQVWRCEKIFQAGDLQQPNKRYTQSLGEALAVKNT